MNYDCIFLPLISWLIDVYNISIYVLGRIKGAFHRQRLSPQQSKVSKLLKRDIDTQDDPKFRHVQLRVEDKTEWLPNYEAGQ